MCFTAESRNRRSRWCRGTSPSSRPAGSPIAVQKMQCVVLSVDLVFQQLADDRCVQRWILDDLQKPAGSAETPEPARTFILIALKGQHFEQRIELDSDAWDLCSRDLTRILDRLRPHFRSKGMALPNDLLTRLAPFFHQDLIFNTIGINYQGKDRQELLNLAALRMEDWVVKDCEEEEEVKRCLAGVAAVLLIIAATDGRTVC